MDSCSNQSFKGTEYHRTFNPSVKVICCTKSTKTEMTDKFSRCYACYRKHRTTFTGKTHFQSTMKPTVSDLLSTVCTITTLCNDLYNTYSAFVTMYVATKLKSDDRFFKQSKLTDICVHQYVFIYGKIFMWLYNCISSQYSTSCLEMKLASNQQCQSTANSIVLSTYT